MRSAWLLPLVLAACSSGGGEARPGPTTAPPASAATGPAATASPTASISVETAPDGVHFGTPSDNIGCVVGAGGVHCQIQDHAWELPPRPRDCDADWGGGVALESPTTVTAGVCASDSMLGAERVLAYGTGIRVGDYQCVSERAGLTCTHAGTGHGFFLSRATLRRF